MDRSSVIDIADANELVLSLSVAAHDGATPLAARVREFAPSAWMWTHLVTVAAEAPAPRDDAALLVRLERTPALELQRRLVGYYTTWFRERTPAAVVDRALRGDAAATRAFLRTSMPEDAAWRASLARRLDAGPERTKRDLIDVVDAWDRGVFAPVARRTMRALRAAVRARWHDRRVRAQHATRVIVPSLVLGDEEHEFDHGPTLYRCVSVATPRRAATDLSALARVLGDERRAAIVSALARGDLRAQDLADEIGLGLSTTLHHLATLRRAGLVERGGRRRRYALRREPLRRMRDVIAGLIEGTS